MSTEGIHTVLSISGDPGMTKQVTLGNGAQSLAELGVDTYLDIGGGRKLDAKAVLVTCETYDCRFAFGSDPTAAFGHLLFANELRYIVNPEAVRNIKFCNATANSNAVLTITPEF